MDLLPNTVIFAQFEDEDAVEYVLIEDSRYVSSTGRSFHSQCLDDELDALIQIGRPFVMIFNPRGIPIPSLLYIH